MRWACRRTTATHRTTKYIGIKWLKMCLCERALKPVKPAGLLAFQSPLCDNLEALWCTFEGLLAHHQGKYSSRHLEEVEERARGAVQHRPGLLAVICISRAICLRSDSGYPNKRFEAWDFLLPGSFFTFFLSGPSLSKRGVFREEMHRLENRWGMV